MARYSSFLGRRVEVHYRAGDILLPASGTFVADSGRSIFLEQHLMQRGQQKHFRWEIPYQYIVRLEEVKEPPAASADGDTPVPKAASGAESVESPKGAELRSSSSAAASASGDASAIHPLGRPPKTA
jgi:hypothetical protein